jgi:hypothetical protein
MKKAIIVAMVFIGFATVACKKDKTENKTVTKADLVASTTWSIDTIGFDMDKNGTIDSEVPGGFKPCEMDNTIKFNKDSTGIFSEGALKCDSADPQEIPFTWLLKQNDSVINIQGNLPGEMKGDINILTLSNTNFVLSKPITVTFPVPFNANLIIALKK